MDGNSTRENREAPEVSAEAGRLEKATSRKTNVYVCGESDGCVVP